MKVALIGDIALLGKYDISKTSNVNKRLEEVRRLLTGYDYVIGNLESPLTDKNSTHVCKSIHVRTPQINVQTLKYLGINVVTIANNHMYDFGGKGLKDTVSCLEENGISWVGCNKKYLTLTNNDEKVNCSAFCCMSTNGVNLRKNGNGVNLLCTTLIDEQIEIDKSEHATSLMLVHWGEEHTHYPLPSTVDIAHSILSRKDNIVICGSHAHCMQGIENYDGKYVAYSLGNFIFDDIYSLNKKFVVKQTEENLKTFIWELDIDKDGIKCQKPIFVEDTQEGIIRAEFSREMKTYSDGLSEYKTQTYMNMRRQEVAATRAKKFGKRDLHWVLSKINYYSIGTKILTIGNKRKYKKIYRGFQENEK